jgi:hypothetical protein
VGGKDGDLEARLQDVLDRAEPDEQARYLRLMRHDPLAGRTYLEGLRIMKGQPDLT